MVESALFQASISGLGIVADLGLIVVFATILAFIGRKLKQPIILAYLVAGIIIGPMFLNLVTHAELPLISELGIAFLLFAVGVETDLEKMKKIGKIVIIGAILQVGITAFITVLFAQLFGLSFIVSLYLGLILAFSSTTIVVKILSDRHEIDTLHGRLIIGYLLVQDFLVIIFLPLLESSAGMLDPILIAIILAKAIGLFALAVLLRKFVFPKIIPFTVKNDELFFLGSITICFIFIFLSFLLKFSPVVGAFLAGISLSTLAYNLELSTKIHALRDFFATIFFVSLGMQISFFFGGINLVFAFALFVFMFFIVLIIKPLLFYLINLFYGFGNRTSLLVGIGLAQVSEFSFILAAQGFSGGSGPISQELFSLIVLVTAISMAITPYVFVYHNWIVNFLSKLFSHLEKKVFFRKKLDELESLPGDIPKKHIVLVGAGLLGEGIIKVLHPLKELIVVDNDPEIVFKQIQQGVPAIYGNIENDEVWQKINLKEASLLLITIPRVEETLYLVKKAKKINPKITIFARAKFPEDALKLYEAGIDFVILPLVIGSNLFIKNVIAYLQTGAVWNITNLETEYMNYLKEEVKKQQKTKFKL